MATRDVSTIAEFNAAHSASVSGDTIRFTDSFADYSGDISVTKPGLTLRAVTSRAVGPRRIISTAAATDLTIADLAIQCREVTDHRPKVVGPPIIDYATPALIQPAGAGTIIQNCLIRGGDSDNAVGGVFPDFDVTRATGDNRPEYGAIGGNNTFNWMVNVPRGLNINRFAGALLVIDNDFHDLCDAFKGTLASNSTIDVRVINNNFRRPYQDSISIGIAPKITSTDAFTVVRFDVDGNFFLNTFAVPQDNLNPHSDCIQIFSADVGASNDTTTPIPNVRVRNNVALQTADCRGQTAFIFLSDIPPGYPFIGAVVENNVCFGRIAAGGLTVSNVPGGGFSTRAARNVILMNPAANTLSTRESTKNNVSGVIGLGSPSLRRITINDDSVHKSTQFQTRNLSEAVMSYSYSRGSRNFNAGKALTVGQYDPFFSTRPNWGAMATPDDVINALKLLKPEYADLSSVQANDNWTTYRNRLDAIDTPFLAFLDLVEQPKNAVVTSEWAYVQRGGVLTAFNGGEYQLADDYNGLNAGAWSSATGVTLPNGKYVRARQTTLNGELNTSKVTYTLGSYSGSWAATTASETFFPGATFNGATRYLSAAQALGPDSGAFTLKVEVAAAQPGTNQNIFATAGASTVNRFQIVCLNTGKLRVLGQNAAGTVVFLVTSTATVLNGAQVEVHLAVDLSIPATEDGCIMYVNGVRDGATPTTFIEGETINFAQTTAKAIGGTTTPNFVGTLYALYIDPTQQLPIDDPVLRAQFGAVRILRNGSGPTGTPPAVFIPFLAGAIQNQGSGPAFTLSGTAPAAANALSWPPVKSQYGPSTITVRDANGQEATLDPFYITIAAA